MGDKNDKKLGLIVDDKYDEQITNDDTERFFNSLLSESADDDKRQGTESGALSKSKG